MNAETGAFEFFETMHRAFEVACARTGTTERFFKIGAHTLRLCFAEGRDDGQEDGRDDPAPTFAARMTRALAHLASPPMPNPALNVLLWDDATTDTRLPRLPWQFQSTAKQFATIHSLNTERIYATFNEYGGILNVFDVETNTALFWTPDARRVPTHEWSTPLRNILHWFWMHNGAFMIHSGAVGLPNGGVLLAGKAGAGKSTTAVACLESELRYAADDYCVLAAEPQPWVYSMYSSAKLHGENLARVPHIKHVVANAGELGTEKATVMLHEAWAEKLILQFPLRAIFLPRVSGARDTQLFPATYAESIRALTLSTISIMPRTDSFAVQKLNRLIQTIPAYHLELGTDMKQIPQVILKILEQN